MTALFILLEARASHIAAQASQSVTRSVGHTFQFWYVLLYHYTIFTVFTILQNF